MLAEEEQPDARRVVRQRAARLEPREVLGQRGEVAPSRLRVDEADGGRLDGRRQRRGRRPLRRGAELPLGRDAGPRA